jgi:predicted PurR-regulated permease PerM
MAFASSRWPGRSIIRAFGYSLLNMPSATSDRDRISQLLFYAAVILIGYLMFLVVEPFLGPLGWAGVLAIALQPVFRALAARLGRSRAAGVCVVVVLLLLVLPVWLLVDALVREGAQAVSALEAAAEHPPERVLAVWSWVQSHVPALAPGRLAETAGTLAQRLGASAASESGRLLGGLASILLDLALAMFGLYFFLRDAPAIVRVLRSFLPFHDQQRDQVVKQVEDLVFASVIAGLAVAAVQGLLGGLGFWIVGVRAPAVWGTVMAFMSLVPLVGASIVWAPVALWFLLTGDATRGLVLIGVGVGLVGMADNILRPMLLSGRSSMNGLTTFVALLGGVTAFGLIGLVFGPVVVAVGAALLNAYIQPVPDASEPQ